MTKRALLVASSLIAALAAAPALAQESTIGTREGEIVVTAQKRVQNVQDVPIANSVVGGEAIQEQGSASLVDYAGYVAGMQARNTGPPGQPDRERVAEGQRLTVRVKLGG